MSRGSSKRLLSDCLREKRSLKRGVFGNGEACVKRRSGKMKRQNTERRFVMMKPIIIAVFMSVAFLLGFSSCATAPKGPLGEGELRLLKMNIPENGNLRPGLAYTVDIIFEADDQPEITKVVCYCSDEGPFYYRIRDVRYGSPGSFSIDFSAPGSGSQRVECYANYVRDGQRRRTNSVFSLVFGVTS